MNKYQKDRLDHLILFFATEHKRLTSKPLAKTPLLKFIDLFEFSLLEENGSPPLELDYIALQLGPVPIDVYDMIDKGDLQTDLLVVQVEKGFNGNENRFILDNGKDYDLDFFSINEVDKMFEILDKFSTNYKNPQELIDETHKLKSWNEAWNNRRSPSSQREEMRFGDTFLDCQDELIKEHFETYSWLSGKK